MSWELFLQICLLSFFILFFLSIAVAVAVESIIKDYYKAKSTYERGN